MIKVGDVVEYYGNVGTVRRVLSDDEGSLAMVQWIGNGGLNLKPIEAELLSLSTKEHLVSEAAKIILKTISELDKHPDLSFGLFDNISEDVEAVLDAWRIDYDDKAE